MVVHIIFAGATPLGCASLFGEVACARFLLDHGADPNKMDETGSVALHNAAKNGTPLDMLININVSK
jgi:ankyrin repeat protein